VDETKRPVLGDLGRFLGVGMAGLAMVLIGLGWDAAIHARDPDAVHEEDGPFDPSNPAHLVMLVGGALVVGGLTGATVRARAAGAGGARLTPFGRAVFLTSAAGLIAAATVSLTRPQDPGPQLLPAPGAPDEHGIGIIHSHPDQPCRPTAAQRRAARKLIEDTQAATLRLATPAAAEAEGYLARPEPTESDHWLNPWYMNDGKVLDPTRPEALVYTRTPAGPVLTGAMFIMNVAGEFGPEVGGCLTRWHVHANLCFSPLTQEVVGELSPERTCPAGSVRYIPPPALHVWFVDVPGGRFAPEIDHDALAQALAGQRRR
jgi:hypothetical protein